MPTPAKEAADQLERLARLREPFPAHQISKLPKSVAKYNQGDPRFNCVANDPQFSKASKDGVACGGYHSWSIHLDYVGHAALTDRLLEVDPFWDWAPVAYNNLGEPLITPVGMWIRLTVCGVTRLGFGDAGGKTGANAVKEIIGDALRNAGMRFGMALDLWHKGDLHDVAAEQGLVAKDEPTPENDVAQTIELDQWVKKANEQTTADEVLTVWKQAKMAMTRGKVPTAQATPVLKAITERGQALRDAEDAEAAQRAAMEGGDYDPGTSPGEAKAEAMDAVRGAFKHDES